MTSHLRVKATGEARFDTSHAALVEQLDGLAQTEDADFAGGLEALSRSLAAHFAEEDVELRRLGSEENRCHLDEHAAVLASVAEVLALGERRLEVGRRLCRELQGWLPYHVEELDMRLAHTLFKARTGGAPVLLRPAPAATLRQPA